MLHAFSFFIIVVIFAWSSPVIASDTIVVDDCANFTTPVECSTHSQCAPCANHNGNGTFACYNAAVSKCCNSTAYGYGTNVVLCGLNDTCTTYLNGGLSEVAGCCPPGLSPCLDEYRGTGCYDPQTERCCRNSNVPGSVPVWGNACGKSDLCCYTWSFPYCCSEGRQCCNGGYTCC